MFRVLAIVLGVGTLSYAARVGASETVTYNYDAKGRLVTVVHAGSANNGVTKTFTLDKADNRQRVVIAGASH